MSISNRKNSYYALYIFHFFIIVFAWWVTSGYAIIELGFGYAANRIGALLGLLGGSFLLFQFLLISRASWLESVFGHDRLTRLHRLNGLIGFSLIIFHPIFIILGSSLQTSTSFLEQFKITASRPYAWLALAGFVLLICIVVSSLVIVRSKLKYETWFFMHLLNYFFLSMVVWHQFSVGTELQTGMWLRSYWAGLYIFIILNLLYFRFIKPVATSTKNNLSVLKVEKHGNVTNVYMDGDLQNINWKGGQFAYWRFLTKEYMKEQHPFSISIEPNNNFLRISAKAVGDYTKKMSGISRGTKVIMDGPHGIFTLDRARSDNFLFVAGGIGITPIRSMLGELDDDKNAVLLYSARKETDLVFKDEIEEIARVKELSLHYFVTEEQTKYDSRRISVEIINQKAPDFMNRDIFICGPPAMIMALKAELLEVRVPKEQIHSELFKFV